MPLKIRSSPLFKIKPQTALEETFILKIKPQRLLEDPLKSTSKDQAHGPLKKLPTVHPRSNLDGHWINEISINTLRRSNQRKLPGSTTSSYNNSRRGREQ
ncbi:hypothetical protein TB2_009281 [Malus domestica]